MACSEHRKLHMLPILTYFLFLWWITCVHVEATSNILKPGDTLNATEGAKLCSEKGTYCMYFGTTYDDENVANLYIYAQKDEWAVWTANRDQPVDTNSAVLALNHSGVLKIESASLKKPIILYSPPQPINNTVAMLLDTGNFVLQQLHPNGSKMGVLWESFDFPTDTLLPGMKLGVNLKTGRKWSLVSWLSKHLPTPGSFSLEWEHKTKQLMIKKEQKLYWAAGENELQNIMGEAYDNIVFVSNENEAYITLKSSDEDLTKWTLLSTGQLINRNGGDVARADLCYGYNTDGGCRRWEDLPYCRDSGDAFELKQGYANLDLDLKRHEENSSYGVNDCQAICWSTCSCVAFTHLYDNETGCTFFLWNSTKGTNIASEGDKFYMLVKTNHNKTQKKWIWPIVAIGATILVICLCLLCCRVLRKRKHDLEELKTKRMGIENEDLEASSTSSCAEKLEVVLKEEHDLKVFKYASIMEATNDFSSENKLGQGGFGPVYKGILSTMQEVAVKKLSKSSRQGLVEFKNELTVISKLQHTNLVQLLGYCIHEEERILIYEYMPNKSLDCILFDSAQNQLLDWNKRFSVIEGIAQGLLYLHKYSRHRIIHRDLKASNILLDENMNPKISDFGIAKMFTQQDSESNTTRIVGTYGYMSPEYAMEGVFSTKSDVYSFGVLLFEIVSGKRNNSFYTEERQLNLVGHTWELWKEGEVLKLVDPSLNDSFSEDEVVRCVHAGLLCVEENADDRPSISNVVSMLTNKTKVTTVPKKPAYYVRTKVLGEETSTKEFGLDFSHENSLNVCSI
ncbi:G-type lectin S-receptor-like serine/threonine-protein kinase CES101 [Vigna unguiculata]|uniref:G-type lectin S-receptor-like serine/threonine-protein kinase CES101 n=1 Tax=Vigna unguiculata TaxID=3917 RepID=UPI0010170E81|nr:G-type lectin S-receptor-like serine/threonine-protein kinase CES101 [Vigna unguiculata]